MPPSLTFDKYWAKLMYMGVTALGDDPIEAFRERLHGQTPPRYQRVAIEKLANDRYEVWVTPELCGAVVKFLDKHSGMDVFRGEKAVLSGCWQLQDWGVMDPERPRIEEGISGPYTVVERTPDSVVLEKGLDNGLTLRRQMTLKPGSTPLEVAFTVTNRGTKAIVPLVKPHPEFWLQGTNRAELWIERQGRWSEQPLEYPGRPPTGAEFLEPGDISRWAAWVPGKHLTIMATVPKENVGKLFYFFNIPNEHVNLELVPVLTPLDPGASRTMKAEYAVGGKKPSRM